MHSVFLRTRCTLHPATALVLWLFFVVWLEFARAPLLGMAALALLPWLNGTTLTQFVRYLRRTRWLLLSLLGIYAYTLPGESLSPMLGSLSPSVDGLQHGALRIARMVLLLATLAMVMTHVPRAALLLGIYRILRPLQLLGVDGERIAVRLWLTLHYAETALGSNQKMHVKQRLETLQLADALPADAPSQIVLPDAGAGWADYLCLLLALALAGISIW